ncbi:Nodulin-like / Major Facilitator Superfamily protein [Zostera marina]|uniref:Nodulin-like / Major Facilitator Superfamily protein n=1 Tax=Zostera marina TaxID=29655 RepID=A0A0K9PFN6_ZOSMR|nr:Nodulin-like / Major Facilitator Superfamily protein [Zostera marina]
MASRGGGGDSGKGNVLLCWSRSTPAGKWLGFVTAVWVQTISGNNYTFSNYSDALKTLMGVTQLQLNNLSVAKDVGKAFGIFAGIASDRLPTSIILLFGSIQGLVGYGAQWLVVSKTIAPLPYWQMCVFLCMGGNSTTWMNTAVLVTCMRNFRRNRGPVSGILKGYVGLSTAIFTDISSALFSNNPSYFLFMLAVVPAGVCLAAMLFLHEIVVVEVEETEQLQKEEKKDYFRIFEIIAVVVAVYLLTYDLLGRDILPEAFTAGLLLLLVAPLGLPMYLIFSNYSKTPLISDEEAALIAEEEEEPRVQEEEEENDTIIMRRTQSITHGRQPELGEDHSLLEVINTSEFWVVFISFLCAVGTGLTVQNNMGQMGLAMGYADVSLFVSLISIFSFFGRIGSGIVSEHFIRVGAVPRPIWNAASQILMSMGYIIMAISIPGSLYIGSIIVGLCYGIRLAVTVPVLSELFGLKYFGLIYNTLILNLPLGSFLFSGLLAGYFYDAEATETADGGNTCVGGHCYRLVFFVMAVTSSVGFVLDIFLTIKTKPLYKKICASKNSSRKINLS